MTWAMLVPRKGTEFPWIAKRAAKFIDQLSRSGATIEALAREIAQARQEGSQTVPERPSVGDSHSNGVTERAVGVVASQARTVKAALEHRMGTRIPPDARILCWLVEFAAHLMNRCDIGSDGKTPLQRLLGQKDNTPILESERRSCSCQPRKQEEESGNRDSIPVFVGMLNPSSEAVVVIGERQENA